MARICHTNNCRSGGLAKRSLRNASPVLPEHVVNFLSCMWPRSSPVLRACFWGVAGLEDLNRPQRAARAPGGLS